MNKTILTLVLMLCLPLAATAEQLYMVRTQESFPEAMLKLQQVIKDHDYQLSRVQRVDIGLTKSGYTTDKYRVVFFGRPDEVSRVRELHPELLAYLPLKIAIFAEGQDTLLVAADPKVLFGVTEPELQPVIARWQRDIDAIFKAMRD